MPTNERRTDGQSDAGRTNAQLGFLLAGIILCLAGAAIAVYFKAIIGLSIIAGTAFFMGYSCTGQKTLDDISRRMMRAEQELMMIGLTQLFMYVLMDAYFSVLGSHTFYTVYVPVTLFTALTTYCGCSLFGKMLRARWIGF